MDSIWETLEPACGGGQTFSVERFGFVMLCSQALAGLESPDTTMSVCLSHDAPANIRPFIPTEKHPDGTLKDEDRLLSIPKRTGILHLIDGVPFFSIIPMTAGMLLETEIVHFKDEVVWIKNKVFELIHRKGNK